MLKDLLGETLQGMLEAEIDDHLGYSKYDYKNKETDDTRNGYSPKTVTSSIQQVEKHHMKQSMSRVAHCIDSGPMEGFWGILKREKYYGRRFTSRADLVPAIEDYIKYYNTQRIQRNLSLMTPVEYHEQYYLAA